MTKKLIRWLVIVAMPFFLGFTWITLVISPAYPKWAYSRPNFPPDLDSRFVSPARVAQLGLVPMTQADRLELALVSVAYLESWGKPEEMIWMLDEQVLPYTGEPLFNDQELSHMIDVKRLTDAIRLGAIGTAVIVIAGLFILLKNPQTRADGYKAIFQGGLATTIILFALAAFIGLGWSIFFVQFHELLFPPGTWTFAYTDGLIRLYPEIFFFYVGLILSLGTLLWGVVTTGVGWWLMRRSR
jgi:integral membrane protein (TIGR01906 family)